MKANQTRIKNIKRDILLLSKAGRKAQSAVAVAGRKYDAFDKAEAQIEKAQDKAERLLDRQFDAKYAANNRGQRKAEQVLDRAETVADRINGRIDTLKAVLKELSR